MIDHDVLIQRSYELAPLSPTIVRLAELVNNPDSDMQAIVQTLSKDPALAGAVLRQANSARFGGRIEIVAVQDAVVRLGRGVILGFAVAAGLRKTADRSLPEFGFSEGMFWRHSCAASLAVEALRKFVRVPIPAAAGTAALLHDIGKLSMAQFLSPDSLRLICRARDEGGRSMVGAEREILGLDHAEVGGLIVQHWRLPESIQVGVTFHHDPDDAPGPMADIVNVAACIADEVCFTHEDAPPMGPSPQAIRRLGLAVADLDAVSGKVLGEIDDASGA